MSQTERLVRFLQENQGATILDITRGLDPFVANPRARISDARKEGVVIECRKREDGRNGFWVRERFDGTLGLSA